MDKLEYNYNYMRRIRGCSEALQKPGRSLQECQLMLSLLAGKVQGNKGVGGFLFEKCNLELKYLSPKNGLSTNPDFVTGVAKIQSGTDHDAGKEVILQGFHKGSNKG